jgi:hypothetical protein
MLVVTGSLAKNGGFGNYDELADHPASREPLPDAIQSDSSSTIVSGETPAAGTTVS